ncbi:hypothetical protein NDU88_006857 [Pleurodeles waltl]|uniref:Uncharacterized protein n=1 Tax=Pleurodeles waltl TaxID=8319 RepID=A0AAV7SQT3_PLEWA|nr:hypothetical protein NDU88_006857 [Pleurodeles waltl]
MEENADKEGRRIADEEENVEDAGVWERDDRRQKRPPVQSQEAREGEDVSRALTAVQEAHRETPATLQEKRGIARCVLRTGQRQHQSCASEETKHLGSGAGDDPRLTHWIGKILYRPGTRPLLKDSAVVL